MNNCCPEYSIFRSSFRSLASGPRKFFSCNTKLPLLICLFLSLSLFKIYGQEQITGLSANPLILDPNNQKNHVKSLKSTAIPDTVDLPFIDDFSSTTIYTNKHYWKDDKAFINSTYPVNPPSIGVATLDAIDSDGHIYKNASSTPFYADELTSNPIKLNTSNQNVILSFFYQAGGIGDTPEKGDSLTVDFFKPDSGKWYRAWAIPGESVSAFKQVLIPVDQSYYKKGFQFRFRNIASIDGSDVAGKHGNADLWNIDYVRLYANRSLADTTIRDVAIVKPLASLMKSYYSMPWPHFLKAFRTEIKSSIDVTVKNNDSITRFIKDPEFKIQEIRQGSNDYFRDSTYALATNISAGSTLTLPADLSNPFQPNHPGDTIRFRIKCIIRNDSIDRHTNDTTTFIQIFSNYFAYDDGSCEAGYGINGQGSENAMAAYKYHVYKTDTLRGLSFYFNPSQKDTTEKYYLTLAVWNGNNGIPGKLLYEKTTTISPVIGSLNQFYTFTLDSGLILSTGDFYIGWIQTEDAFLNIGLDLNNDNKNKLFYNLHGTWENSAITGTLMLHPVFRNAKDGFVTNTDNKKISTKSFSIYPNPAQDIITIRTGLSGTPVLTAKIVNTSGKILLLNRLEGSTLDVSNLPCGLYILQLSAENITFAPVKFMIQR